MYQLKNATIVTLEDFNSIYDHCNLAIDHGKIIDISIKDYDCESIDLNGDIILPGFIDNHFHSMDILIKGVLEDRTLHETTHTNLWLNLRESISNYESKISSLKSYNECLKSGVTFVHDVSYYLDNNGLIKAAHKSDIRSLIAVDNISDMKNKVNSYDLNKKVNFSIKVPEEDHIDINFFEKLKQFIDKNNDIITTMHIAETKFRVNQFKEDIISFLKKYNIIQNSIFVPSHGIYLKKDELRKIVPTIISEFKLKDGKFDFNKFNLIGVGTDGFFWSDSNILEEMKFRKIVYNLSSYQILRQATYNNAKILGLEDHFGTLSKGKVADFIVIDRDKLEPLVSHNGSYVNLYDQIVMSLKPDMIKDVYIDGKKVSLDDIDKEFIRLSKNKIKSIIGK